MKFLFEMQTKQLSINGHFGSSQKEKLEKFAKKEIEQKGKSLRFIYVI